MKNKIILFMCLILLVGCKKDSVNCGVACTYNEQFIFQTGFKGTTFTNAKYGKVDLAGTDTDLSSLNSWEGFMADENIGTVRISYEEGDDSQRLASLVDDPDAAGNEVLKFHIVEPHIKVGSKKKGRVQMNLSGNKCVKEIYQTVRLRLHPDMAQLLQWEERVSWLSLFEFWNNADWTKEKYPFRVTVNLYKDGKGVQNDLRFHVKGDYKKNCKACKFNVEWEEENTSFSIPFGQWMTIELYIKEGDTESGNFYMAVTPDGGSKEVIFNINNTTQHPKEKCPDGFTDFQPLKFYTSDKLINYMKDNNKELSVLWDDWKFYINKQP
jgi:hypothetical protein